MTMPFRGKTKSSIGVPPVSSAKTGMSSGRLSKEVLSHGIDSMQPIAERIARGWLGSVQKGESSTFSAPNASALLNIEPKLKGERMSSAKT